MTGALSRYQRFPHSRESQQQPRQHHDRAGDVPLGILPAPHRAIRGDADHRRKLGLREAELLAGGLEFIGGHHSALVLEQVSRLRRAHAAVPCDSDFVSVDLDHAAGVVVVSFAAFDAVADLELTAGGLAVIVDRVGGLHRRLRIWRAPSPLRRSEYRPGHWPAQALSHHRIVSASGGANT